MSGSAPGAAGPARLLIEAAPGERRLLVERGGRLVAFAIDRPGSPDGMGDIHLGRVQAVLPALAGVFVALAGGAGGFLPFAEAAPRPARRGKGGPPPRPALAEGEAVTVQVIRAAQAEKLPRLTTRLRLASRHLALAPAEPAADPTPRPGAPAASDADLAAERAWLAVEAAALAAARRQATAPALLRRAPEAPLAWLQEAPADAAAIVTDDAALFARLRGFARQAAPDLLPRLALHQGPAPLLDPALAEEADALARPEAALPGGGRLRILPTPALTAIDVDSGAAAALRQPEPEAHRVLNLAAAAEVARQIVLRNLSGLIVVDFVSLARPELRAEVLAALRGALAADPLGAEVPGWTRGGAVEVLRRRVHLPLHELLGPASAAWAPSARTLALAALRRAWREALARPALRPRLRVAPALAEALAAEAGALAEFAARSGRPLIIAADSALAPDGAMVEDCAHG